MVKNKRSFILVIAIFLILFCNNFSMADSKIIDSTIIPKNVKEGDVYLYGNDIMIDYPINGNLFIFANKVNITSEIKGDVFVLADDLNISNTCSISNNLFSLCDDITVSGNVLDIYCFCEDFDFLNGTVKRDLKVFAKNVNLLGLIGRNSNIYTSILNVNNETKINGNLKYFASQPSDISENVVEGLIDFKPIENNKENKNNNFNVFSYIISIISFCCLVIFIWLLMLWLCPKTFDKINDCLRNKKSKIALYGILSFILLPIISLTFLFIGITANISLLILSFYIILLFLSKSFFVVSLNKLICNKYNLEKSFHTFLSLIVVSIIFSVIQLIPIIGPIFGFISLLTGLGIFISLIIPESSKS